jgi:hypothetical protein
MDEWEVSDQSTRSRSLPSATGVVTARPGGVLACRPLRSSVPRPTTRSLPGRKQQPFAACSAEPAVPSRMDTSSQGVAAVFSRMQERDWLRSRAGIRSQLAWGERLTPELGDVRLPGRKEKRGAAARHERRDTRVAYMASRNVRGNGSISSRRSPRRVSPGRRRAARILARRPADGGRSTGPTS